MSKDSLKSTWRTGDKSKWTHHHHIIDKINAYPTNLDEPIPVHKKTDPIPYLGQTSQHAWVLVYTLLPIALHQAWLTFTGIPFNGFAAANYYFLAWNLVIIREVHILRRLGHKYGFLDGDVAERDGIPDVGVPRIAASLYKTTGTRIAMAAYLTYSSAVSPLQILSNWQWWGWLALEIGLYPLVIDFWFYLYHRAMHDIGPLWKFHRTHHLSKHPNPLLSAYADHEQEFFDMVVIPMLTYFTLKTMGVPIGFYDWFICHQYVSYTEVWGHCGIRVYLSPPSTFNPILTALDAEIIIEDHDLHHRKGYRKSHNYGKQTRVWDRLFGTTHKRIECVPENIDYVNQATIPIF